MLRKILSGSCRSKYPALLRFGLNARFGASKQFATTVLHEDRMNIKVKEAEYAVRGNLVLTAEALQQKLAEPNHGLPMDEIIFCNIGNPQSVGQSPLTYIRQALSLYMNPELLSEDNLPLVKQMYPEDIVDRAQEAMRSSPSGFGAYSHSMGLPWVRKEVAAFIAERDGFPADPDNIFLTNGASEGIAKVLEMLLRDENDGVLIPIPQYPLYTATLALLGGKAIPYYLDEGADWGTNVESLTKALEDAKQRGITPRGMVVINPGNPTGQVLGEQTIKDMLVFCHDNSLVMLADEVYQSNIYGEQPFHSMKKSLAGLGDKYANTTELISYHSTSKGFLGECGLRGGYMEVTNMDPYVKEQLYKMVSVSLCSNLVGQLTTGLMVSPPKPGQASHALYVKERDAILGSLKERSQVVRKLLNELEGVTCNAAAGSMYLFPSITLSETAVAKAKEAGYAPDEYYCIELLKSTGICVVPGSGFGQEEGTWHFRTTFLPPKNKIEKSAASMKAFHEKFVRDHA